MWALLCKRPFFFRLLLLLFDEFCRSSGDRALTSKLSSRVSFALQRGHSLDDILQPCVKYLPLPNRCISLFITKKKVLVRLQLPLFGQERESNILSVEGGKGGSKNAAASRMRESIKKDGLTRRDPPQMEMWASDGAPCRRDVGRSTRLLRSVFTCGSPGC